MITSDRGVHAPDFRNRKNAVHALEAIQFRNDLPGFGLPLSGNVVN